MALQGQSSSNVRIQSIAGNNASLALTETYSNYTLKTTYSLTNKDGKLTMDTNKYPLMHIVDSRISASENFYKNLIFLIGG